MTYAGARGETAEQMADTLHFDLAPGSLHPAFANLVHSLSTAMEGTAMHLATANRLWGQQGEPFKTDFLRLIAEHYSGGGGFQAVDFHHGREDTRKLINAWVEHNTLGTIDELLQQHDLNAATVMVLTNAIYFRGLWDLPFDPRKTHDGEFHTSDGKTIEVPMMWQAAESRFIQTDLLSAVELPYDGDRLSMVVLVPNERDGLAALEQQLSGKSLNEWIEGMKTGEVMITLPRFKFSSRFDLSDTLAKMGMPLAFSGSADFTGMHKYSGIFIDKVIHQAYIDVNEEGTEASGATAVVMKRKGGHPVIRADHPFMFLIRDRETGSILFLGRVMNPIG